MKEEDKYTEFEVCKVCRLCAKFQNGCAGKSAVVYAHNNDLCFSNFVKKEAENEII